MAGNTQWYNAWITMMPESFGWYRIIERFWLTQPMMMFNIAPCTVYVEHLIKIDYGEEPVQ